MNRFFVVVPFYNEADWILSTLDALAAQSDRDYTLVCVDNGSTDASAQIVRDFARRGTLPDVRLVVEPLKGTGAASDTGFRYSILNGATHLLRTDADCIPASDWIAKIRRTFASGAEMVAGRIVPRKDREYRLADAIVLPLLLGVVKSYAKRFRRGRGYKSGWMLVAGNNLAITAGLYTRCGGFPRSDLSQQNEDRVLFDRARAFTDRIVYRDDVVVYNSIRRVRAYGYVNTLLWYWDRKYRPRLVDIR